MNNNKLKILYLHANHEDIGGADYCLFKLAAQLRKDKFLPVVCLSMKTPIIDLYKKIGIKVYVIDMERMHYNKNPFYLAKLAIKFFPSIQIIRKIIKKENIDIIHGNDLIDIYAPVAGRLSGVFTIQHIRWPRLLISPAFLRRILPKFIYKLSNKIVTVSDGLANDIFPKKKYISSKVVTCHDWIDMDKVGHLNETESINEEYSIPLESIIVGFVGRLVYWKGPEIFIRAASIVAKTHPDVFFILVGEVVKGRRRELYGSFLKKMAYDLNIHDKIIFAGHRTDIFNIMNSLDIFVHTSVLPDPLPGVVMEAMFCSKPVIGANAGGVPEEVVHGITGLLYAPGNHKEMAEAIIYLLQNPEVAKKMGRAGKERVEKLFNKQDLCAKMERIYEELVCQCQAPLS